MSTVSLSMLSSQFLQILRRTLRCCSLCRSSLRSDTSFSWHCHLPPWSTIAHFTARFGASNSHRSSNLCTVPSFASWRTPSTRIQSFLDIDAFVCGRKRRSANRVRKRVACEIRQLTTSITCHDSLYSRIPFKMLLECVLIGSVSRLEVSSHSSNCKSLRKEELELTLNRW